MSFIGVIKKIKQEVIINEKKELEAHVIDTGIGIPASIKNQLFTESHRKSEPGTSKEKGFGLGLRICKKFIEAHSGTIGVISELNKGSDFYFTLPVN